MIVSLNENCQRLIDILNTSGSLMRVGYRLSQCGINIRGDNGELKDYQDTITILRNTWDDLSQDAKKIISTVLCQEHACTGLGLTLLTYRCAKSDGRLSSHNAEAIKILERFCWYLDTINVGIASEIWDYLDKADDNEGEKWIRTVFNQHIQNDDALSDCLCSRRKRKPLLEEPIFETEKDEDEVEEEISDEWDEFDDCE